MLSAATLQDWWRNKVKSSVKEGVTAAANSQGNVEVIEIKMDAKELGASQDSSLAPVNVRGTGCTRLTR